MNHLGALAAVAVGLVGMIAWEVSDGPPAADVPPPPPPTAQTASRASAPAVDRVGEWVATALARPLFSPDRRPASVAVTVATAGPSGLPRLTGILVGPSERSAIFAAAGRNPIVVHEGGRIDAYTVMSIEAGEVRLRGPDGVRILHPTFQSRVDSTTQISVPAQQFLGQAAVPR
jgi:hypothetical protein